MGLSPICYTSTAIKISFHRVPSASGLILVHRGIGIHLSWFAPPPTSTNVRLLLGVGSVPPSIGRSEIFLKVAYVPRTMGQGKIFPRVGSASPTMGWNKILPRVASAPPTTSQSVSGVFFKGFFLWTGSGPPAYYCAFTIFSWKFGIEVVSDTTFQSQNHSVEPSF